MKILLIHNKYGKFSGEEAVVETQLNLLREKGHDVITYFRSSEELDHITNGKLKAFFSAFYNKKCIKAIQEIITKEKPDVAHVHNLYPLISPAILPAIKKMGVPVVMTVHNYRLLCPNGLFYTNGAICEKCTGPAKELNCITQNCEDSLFKSTGYALRNLWARTRRYYLNHVDTYLCLTEFQKQKLISNEFQDSKCIVVPNIYNKPITPIDYDVKQRHYIAFAGRLSPEKGLPVLMAAAKELPDIQFRLAGAMRPGYDKQLDIPKNVKLLGMLNAEEMKSFYTNARLYLHTSVCYEGFPMVFPEAMAYQLPIIAPNMAGYPEIAEHNFNGLLFTPEDVPHLVETISKVWNNNNTLSTLANNGFNKLKAKYTKNAYYEALAKVYLTTIG